MREYVARLLADRYVVEAVPDGQAALEAAIARPPALVLSDVMMPSLDGFALVDALRADDRTREVPIILLSARAGEEARVEGLQGGADDYLAKPFSARELLARVESHIELVRMRTDAAHREREARVRAEALAAEQARLQGELREVLDTHVQLNAELRRASQTGEALRHQAEERTAMLEELDRLKDELLATASHDLKSPLTSIKGYAQLLLRGLNVPAPDLQQMRQGLAVISAQTTVMTGMLDDLLDAARIHAGAFAVRLEPCSLGDCVAGVLARLNPEDHARVEIALEGELAGHWDRQKIEQVLANLLGNALKYSPSGQPVRIEARQHAGEVAVAVSDRGVGIAPAELPRLFARFHRTPRAQASGLPGTGLGLFICRGIVEAHAGQIWAESSGEGQGSTFRFSLPQGPPAAAGGV